VTMAMLGLDQLADVYTMTEATGLHDTLVKSSLRCRLAHPSAAQEASVVEQPELRKMLFEPGYEIPAFAQVEVDGLRWFPVTESFRAYRGPTSQVIYRMVTVERSFVASATIMRSTPTVDSQGSPIDSYLDVGTYPCSFGRNPTRPLERENQPRIQAIAYWVFVFARAVDVRATDRIVADDRTFEVVNAEVGSADTVRRVMCMEIA